MCFHSSHNHYVQCSWHYGKDNWKETHLLGFDASKNVARYGIIWEVQQVIFKVNDRAIVVTSIPQNHLQDPQLQIRLSLLPLSRDDGFDDLVERDIQLFRISHSKNVDNPKSMLLVVHRGTHDVTVTFIAIFTIALIISFMLLFFYWKRYEESRINGYYKINSLDYHIAEVKG